MSVLRKSVRLGLLLGAEDVWETYRRSIVGPSWITLGLGIQVATIGIVFSLIFSVEIASYLPYLATSLVTWNLIQFTLNESSNSFIQAERLIKQMPMNAEAHVLRVVWKNIVVFAHTVVIVPIVFLIFGYWPGWEILLAPVGLALVVINLSWLGTVFGVLSARFRDVPPIIQSLLTMVFYVTPIIWLPEAIPEEYRPLVLGANPMFHLIEVVRQPLLGELPTTTSIFVVAITAILGTLLAHLVLSRFQHRIPFWV